MMKKSTRKQRWNYGGTILLRSKEMKSRFPGPNTCPWEHKKAIYGTFYRFEEEDAADGTSFAPSDPSRSTRQFASSETKHSTMNTSTTSAPTRQKKDTLPQGYRHHLCVRLLQIGDDQGPHADNVGCNINKMRRTQVLGQDGLFQSGARGHPIARLSTFQPIDDEFGHGEPVQTAKYTGSCPL